MSLRDPTHRRWWWVHLHSTIYQLKGTKDPRLYRAKTLLLHLKAWIYLDFLQRHQQSISPKEIADEKSPPPSPPSWIDLVKSGMEKRWEPLKPAKKMLWNLHQFPKSISRAGVILFTINKLTGMKHYMFGVDSRWRELSDCGGHPEAVDKGNVILTAWREFLEEARYFSISKKVFFRSLSTSTSFTIHDASSLILFVQVSTPPLIGFQSPELQCRSDVGSHKYRKFKEMIGYEWISSSTLQNMILNGGKSPSGFSLYHKVAHLLHSSAHVF